jgi:hypothetical protein
MRRLGRVPLLLAVALAGCGTLSSGVGAPAPVPASGLGPSVPWSDNTGLSWEAPFIFADPAVDLAHPSVIASGNALDIWVEATPDGHPQIVHAHADSFEDGFGATDLVRADATSPAMLDRDGTKYLFYLDQGRIGIQRNGAEGLIYSDGHGPIDSLAAGRLDDGVRLALLVDQMLLEITLGWDEIDGFLAGQSTAVSASPTDVGLPAGAIHFLDVGLRIEPTGTGRLREDLLFAAQLPSPSDLGSAAPPSQIDAATRYLDQGTPPLEAVATPLLGGMPPPRAPTALSYDGGVLLFYSARSGPRNAIGVARHP